MAVAAVGGYGQSRFFQGSKMDADLILFDKFSASFGLDSLQMASLACFRKVEGVNAGGHVCDAFGVVSAVAVSTGHSAAVLIRIGLDMDACLVLVGRIFMAFAAGNRIQFFRMRKIFNIHQVRVAVHAGEASFSMDGRLELFTVHIERFSVSVFQLRVFVADHAVFVGPGKERRGKKEEWCE